MQHLLADRFGEGAGANPALPLQVITKKGEGGLLEPFEEAHVEVPEEHVGQVVDLLGSRKGQMLDMSVTPEALALIKYRIPTRCCPPSPHPLRLCRPGAACSPCKWLLCVWPGWMLLQYGSTGWHPAQQPAANRGALCLQIACP